MVSGLRKKKDVASFFRPFVADRAHSNNLFGKVTQTGAKVKVHWTKDEVGDSGWKAGWYVGTVQSYDEETDVLCITYAGEPNDPYEEDLSELIDQGKIKLLWCPI